MSEYLGVYVTYSKASGILERFLGLSLSTRALQQNIAEDTTDVEAYYEQKPPPLAGAEAEIMVIQADGKGVPMVLEGPGEPKVRLGTGQKRGHKKEALVTAVYTIAPAPRTPEEVVASFFHPDRGLKPQKTPPRPQNKHIWATLEGKDVALARLAKPVTLRQGDHIQHKVALCDGCQALQIRLEAQFPDFKLLLDFIHANEYLWKVAISLLGETHEQRTAWVAAHTLRMLCGGTEQIIADFRKLTQEPQRTSAQRETLCKTANYFERNLPYLAHGWPIASGVIEGACRHFVKDRFELSGMRWTQQGAENLLRLRAVAENDDWEAYHHFRKDQRHRRLYASPFPSQAALEVQSLDSTSFGQTPPTISARQVPAVLLPRNSDNQGGYHDLPLAA